MTKFVEQKTVEIQNSESFPPVYNCKKKKCDKQLWLWWFVTKHARARLCVCACVCNESYTTSSYLHETPHNPPCH